MSLNVKGCITLHLHTSNLVLLEPDDHLAALDVHLPAADDVLCAMQLSLQPLHVRHCSLLSPEGPYERLVGALCALKCR